MDNETLLGNESAETVKLGKLVWIDDEFVDSDGLADALGDRYLCANNPFHANIRRKFQSFGFRFSCEPTRSWLNYSTLSLLMLQDIVDSGVVPYRDNGKTLRMIVEKCPSLEMKPNQLLALLARNYALHESAHCISYRILGSLFGQLDLKRDKDLYVLACLLCESYANLLERLGACVARSDVHQLFFTINSFAECRRDVCSLLRDSLRILGFAQTFSIGMLAFLYLNTHESEPTDEDVDAIIECGTAGRVVSEASRCLSRAVVSVGFGLNRKFRAETTPLFFRYMGCETEWDAVRNRPFDAAFLEKRGVTEAIEVLSNQTSASLLIGEESSSRSEVVLASALIDASKKGNL